MNPGTDTTLSVMRQAARVLQSPTASLGDEVRAIDRAEKALAMAKAAKLAEMEATRAHESEGASSITVWARREIQQDAGATRAQVRSVNTNGSGRSCSLAWVRARCGSICAPKATTSPGARSNGSTASRAGLAR